MQQQQDYYQSRTHQNYQPQSQQDYQQQSQQLNQQQAHPNSLTPQEMASQIRRIHNEIQPYEGAIDCYKKYLQNYASSINQKLQDKMLPPPQIDLLKFKRDSIIKNVEKLRQILQFISFNIDHVIQNKDIVLIYQHAIDFQKLCSSDNIQQFKQSYERKRANSMNAQGYQQQQQLENQLGKRTHPQTQSGYPQQQVQDSQSQGYYSQNQQYQQRQQNLPQRSDRDVSPDLYYQQQQYELQKRQRLADNKEQFTTQSRTPLSQQQREQQQRYLQQQQQRALLLQQNQQQYLNNERVANQISKHGLNRHNGGGDQQNWYQGTHLSSSTAMQQNPSSGGMLIQQQNAYAHNYSGQAQYGGSRNVNDNTQQFNRGYSHDIQPVQAKPQISMNTLFENLKKYQKNVKPPQVVELRELKSQEFLQHLETYQRTKYQRDRVGPFFSQVLENTSCKFFKSAEQHLLAGGKNASEIFQKRVETELQRQAQAREIEEQQQPDVQIIDEAQYRMEQEEFESSVKQLLQKMKEMMLDIKEYIKENNNFTISVQKNESDILFKTVILYIDCDNRKAYVLELKRQNQLIGLDETSGTIRKEIDINDLNYLFEDSTFTKYIIQRQKEVPITVAQQQQPAQQKPQQQQYYRRDPNPQQYNQQQHHRERKDRYQQQSEGHQSYNYDQRAVSRQQDMHQQQVYGGNRETRDNNNTPRAPSHRMTLAQHHLPPYQNQYQQRNNYGVNQMNEQQQQQQSIQKKPLIPNQRDPNPQQYNQQHHRERKDRFYQQSEGHQSYNYDQRAVSRQQDMHQQQVYGGNRETRDNNNTPEHPLIE
eukprot:403367999